MRLILGGKLMKTRLLSLAIGMTVIQGCSGGSGTKTTSELLSSSTYTKLQEAGNSVYVKNHAENESFVSELPTGALSYNGVAAFTTTAPAIAVAVTAAGTAGVKKDLFSGGSEIPNALGHMTINANFASKTATGKIDNIRTVKTTTAVGSSFAFKTGYTMLGEIDIKNGVIAQNELTATFVGDLNNEGISEIYQGTLKGLFVGKKGEGLYGDFDTGTIAGGAANSLKGGFLLESQ
jgi:hypothetical protein